jgi:sterol 14-demethylase
MTATDTELREPPKVSGGDEPDGHLGELRDDPIGLMQRVRDECGDVGEFRLADRDVVLLTGSEANEVFFRAEEEVLDQAEPAQNERVKGNNDKVPQQKEATGTTSGQQ